MIDFGPDYLRAVQKESFARDCAYVRLNGPLTERVGQFELRQMLYGDFLALRITKSPFILGHEAMPSDFFSFLWRLSPHYPDERHRRKLLRACREINLPQAPRFISWMDGLVSIRVTTWEKRAMKALDARRELDAAIRGYVAESLQDWPSSRSGGSNAPSYFSDAATIVGMIARDYGWSIEDILNTPIKCILQQLNEIRAANGQKIFFNPSDVFKGKWMAEKSRN